ncbi:MAG: TonB-dependent receptor plug domain-containing protein [Bdellovibrionales bacterium]|nr:TonB-dependent receptor plug domain-containing protein [Bdellovibrionales bacterium]
MSFLVTLIVSGLLSHAHDHDHDHSQPLHTILVTPENFFDSHRHDTTDRVEVLNKAHIDQSNATTLNEAVDRMQGVDSQDYCANCGAKRISINGLRGDHTSVLIDGIPLYSAVTSVYGFDAIPMQSVGEIEVMRGTGSALLNPEAIGGTINIITLSPTESGAKATASYGTYNSRIFELLNNYVSESKKYKLSVGGELSRQNPWDVDNNGMSESPWRNRYSLFLKQSVNVSDTLQWATRLSFADLEIIGGNMARFRLQSPISLQASENDFVDGDVRKPYIGEISKISERVQVQRTELTSKMIKILDSTSTLEWNLGGANYNQDSIYLHAFDYKTKDLTLYTDLRWRTQLTTNQTLLLGTSARQETLRSQSVVMYDTNNIPKDDFDYTAYSIFAQHEWSLPYNWELSSALRFEKNEE